MAKRFVAWAMTICMMFSLCMAVPAFSAGAAAPEEGNQIQISDARVCPGETIVVPVVMTGNCGVANLSIEVNYNPDVLKLVKVENVMKQGVFTKSSAYTVRPYCLIWVNTTENMYYSGTLANLSFEAVGVGNTDITVDYYKGRNGNYVQGVNVNVDKDRNAVPFQYTGGSITVAECDHQFGSWSETKPATIFFAGEKERTCELCGKKEAAPIDKLEVDVENDSNYGRVHFHVADAKTGDPVPNVNLNITMGEEDVTLCTDENGELVQVLPVGKLKVSAYKSGFLARNIEITVAPGENDLPALGISSENLVKANLTSTPMTYNEIVEAGIDVNEPGNNHVYKYEAKFVFSPEIDALSIVTYFNTLGQCVGFRYDPDEDEAGIGDGEPGYTLHYHLEEWYRAEDGSLHECYDNNIWHSWCKTVSVEKGETVALTYHPYRTDYKDCVFDAWYKDPEFTQKIYSTTIEDHNAIVYGRWICKKDLTPEKPAYRTELPDKTPVAIYPISEKFYLIIYGEVKWLKEMYNVQLVAINDSATDTVENCVAELTLPEGLSLAEMVNGTQSLVEEIGHLGVAGSEDASKTVSWFVRGDKEGTYDISAKLTGTMEPFGDSFCYDYTLDNPLVVYAGSALHITFEAPSSTFYNDDYVVKITLENVSDRPIYNLSHTITGLEQCRITQYSDGSEEREVYLKLGEIGSINSDIFYPGDKMVVEITTNIMFQSELYEYQLKRLCDFVDECEKLYEGYKCFNFGAKLIDSLIGFVDKASDNIDEIIKKVDLTDADIAAAYSKLAKEIADLEEKVKAGDSEALQMYQKLQSTGVLDTIQDLAESSELNTAITAAEISRIADGVHAITGGSASAGEEFDIFDTIRTAIQAIPIRFVLEDVVITTLEGSTTEIPYTVKVVPSNKSQYFGVDDLGSFFYDALIAGMGEIDVPFYAQIFGINDPTGYEDAVKRLTVTMDKMKRLQAESATGKTVFKAWIEPNKKALLKASGVSKDFELSSDNATATVDKNGVLTFTGAGYIEVLPTSGTGGTLYVEMEEEGEKKLSTYEIDVVEEHECSSEAWATVISPTETESGYAVKQCDICHEIIEMKELTLCDHHTFGEYCIDSESEGETLGLKHRTCQNCGYVEYSFTEGYSSEDGTLNVKFDTFDALAEVTIQSDPKLDGVLDSSKVVASAYRNGKMTGVVFKTLTYDAVSGIYTCTLSKEDFKLPYDEIRIFVLNSDYCPVFKAVQHDMTGSGSD